MKKLIVFILFSMSIFSVEKNIAFGIYTQDGQYKGQGIQYFPNIVATYGDYYLEGLEIGKVLYNDKFKLSTFFKYETVTGFEASDLDMEYKDLDDRKPPLLLGFRSKKQMGKITYMAEIFGDFRSSAFGSGIGASSTFRPFEPLFLIPSVKVFYYDKNYGNYFYGISRDESQRTGLDEINIVDGTRLEISLDTLLFLSESFGFALRTTYEFIDENWESEIVEDNESFKGSLLVIYRF